MIKYKHNRFKKEQSMENNDYIRANWVLFKQIYNDDIVLDAVKKEIFE